MGIKLDALDRKILYTLDGNARLSISDLSRRVRHGRDIVDYRLTRLFNEGVLVRASAVIDPYQLGLTLFKTYVRLNNNRTRCSELLSRLKKNSKVFCVAHCDGPWDIVFNSLAQNAREFDTIQEEMLNPFRDIISDSEVAVVVEQRYYPKKFLLGKGEGGFIIGTEPNFYFLDKEEAHVLSLLVRNARSSFTELADETGTTPSVIKRSIEKLEERKIIVGYRVEVNRALLEITRFKTQISFENYSTARGAALQQFCERHPHVSNYIKQVGRFKLECSIDAESYEHYNSIIDEMRTAFSDIIHNVGTLLIRDELYRWVSDNIGETIMPQVVSISP